MKLFNILCDMKFLFVVGGSYKSFYINQMSKIKNIDLLVFHKNIFYDFDYEQEYLYDAPVTKELISLNETLNCPIIVYGYCKMLSKRKKSFVICVNGKVSVIDNLKDVYLYIKGKVVLIGNKLYNNPRAFATITIMDNQQNWENISKKKHNNYFICDKTGVSRLQNGKIYRKFRKCCYFTLCFYKKMV